MAQYATDIISLQGGGSERQERRAEEEERRCVR